MKKLVIFLFLLSGMQALAGIFDDDIALDGDPTPYSIINGRYSFHEIGPNMYVEFRADRKYGEFGSPQRIKCNIPMGRWEVLSLKAVAGVVSEHLVATSRFSSRVLTDAGVTYRFPPLAGWVCSPVAYPLTAYVPVEVVSVNRPGIAVHMWENPLTWSTGTLPRKYDNVRIGLLSVQINSNVFCQGLIVGGTVVGLRPFTLNVLGNLEIIPPYGSVRPYQVRMGGMSRQVIRTEGGGDVRSTMYPAIFIIDNPSGIETKYWIDLATMHRGASIVRFVKGHFFLKERPSASGRVFIPKVEGANAERFFVLSKTAELSTLGSDPTSSRTYHVGVDEFTYTPITLTRAGKPSGAPFNTVGLVPSEDDETAPGKININYIIDAPGMWNIHLGWNPTAQSSSYVPGQPVHMMRGPGAWEPVGDPAVPWGVYTDGHYLYSVYQPGVSIEDTWPGVWFSLFQAGAKGKARMSAVAGEEEKNKLADGPFPNPAGTEGFRVRVFDPKKAKLSLVGISGQPVAITSTSEPGNMILVKPASQLGAGVYQLLVETDGRKIAHRVVIH